MLTNRTKDSMREELKEQGRRRSGQRFERLTGKGENERGGLECSRFEMGEVLGLERKAALRNGASPRSREAPKRNDDGQLTAA
jgi:hypothetical protein